MKKFPFVSDEIERALKAEFARICGVDAKDGVHINVADSFENPSITLTAHTELKEGTRDTELTISMKDKNEFIFTGYVNAPKEHRDIGPLKWHSHGAPDGLPKAMAQLLASVKVKKGIKDSILRR